MVTVIGTGGVIDSKDISKVIAQHNQAIQANQNPLITTITNTTQQYNASLNNVGGLLSGLMSGLTTALSASISQSNATLSYALNQVAQKNAQSIQNRDEILTGALASVAKAIDNNKSDLSKIKTEFIDVVKAHGTEQEQQTLAIKQQSVAISNLTERAIELQNKQLQTVNNRIEELNKRIDNFVSKSYPIEDCNNIDLPSYLEPFRAIIELSCRIKSVYNYFVSRAGDIETVFLRLERGDYNDLEQLYNSLFGQGVSKDIIEGLLSFINVMPLFLEILHSQSNKAHFELSLLNNRTTLPNRLSEGSLLESYRRNIFDLNEFYDRMKDLGWSSENSELFRDVSTYLLSAEQYVEAYRRNFISKNDLYRNLKIIGMDDSVADLYEQLAWFIPPVQDVIRMAIRDVFTPDVIAQGGLFKDIPEEYVRRARLSGLSEENAKLYWAAHWIIPSIEQGYELLHRGVITRQELETLFKAADIAPLWRDKLLAISYRLPTRVDVRRMYEDGVIDDNRLSDYLTGYGYAPDDVERVSQWYKKRREQVKKSSLPNTKTMSQSQIVKAYSENLITHDIAMSKLVSLGYLANDANFLLSLASINNATNIQAKLNQDITNSLFKLAKDGYTNYVLDDSDAISMLTSANFTKEQANIYIALWKTELEIDRKKAYTSQMQKMFIGYEIDENSFKDNLVQNGFTIEHASQIVADVKPFRELRTRDLSRADLKKAVSTGVISLDEYVSQLASSGYSDRDIEIIARLDGVIK